MAVKNTRLGGVDNVNGEIIDANDVNDTFNETQRGGFYKEAITPATAENNSIFLDSTDNVLKIKDNSGAVRDSLSAVELIYEETLSSNGSFSVTGLSLEQYQKVEVVMVGKGTSTIPLQFKLNTIADYDFRTFNFVSITDSGANSISLVNVGDITSGIPGDFILTLFPRTGEETKFTTYLTVGAFGDRIHTYGQADSTADITRIDLFTGSGSIASGATLKIYGYK